MKTVIGIIVAIIIIGGGAFALVKNSDNKDKKASPATSSSTPSNSDETASTEASSSATSNTSTVTIENMAFSPADITVAKGTTVTWTNKDSVGHNVIETDGKDGPKSADLNQGQTYSFTYMTAGTFKYHCSIHPGMTGTVTVTE